MPSRRAVVVGSGPNGLAAAITLAQAGLQVVVHEAADRIGGGTRTEELTLPGFRHDVCSAIHPLGRSSSCFAPLELGIEWRESPACLAHPFDDAEAALLRRSVDETAAALGADAAAYRNLIGPLAAAWRQLEPLVLGPFPLDPRAPLRLLRTLGARGSLRALHAALSSAAGLAERSFETPRGRAFLAGNAAHSMLPLETRPSAGFALVLLVLGHAVGWPFPRGGSQAIADALAERLRGLGGEIVTSSRVDELPRADVVMCDVSPHELRRIAGLPDYARRFRHGPGAFKLDWALSGPIPWRDPRCAEAATVHLGATFEEISASERQPGTRPPFVLLAQPSLWDETRAPAGRHTAWAYCHVPNGSALDMTEAIEAQVERFAPGFREVVLARCARGPAELEAYDANLVGGDLNGGRMDLRQTWTRPTVRLVPYRTPRRGVYLCSASTPPGGGVHGMCGFAAARVALRDLRR
ncbi:MAG TPA: NAD(P)/FAD-dependent oxidoreductase [Gaiellaceae bacterium]|nr:NAD(P)/FAD-dependent oxidoreductase [Gaiellaceae bacterium]